MIPVVVRLFPGLVLLAAAAAAPALAQEASPDRGAPREGGPADGDASPPAPVVTPPVLIRLVEAEYPAAARDAGLEAAVELELVVAADGTVSAARVVVSAGEGFDEAALAAVRAFAFEPARRDGVALAARIRYRYVFELRAAEPEVLEAPEVPAAPRPGRLEGRLEGRGGEGPIGDGELTVASVDGAVVRVARCDADGRFVVDGLPPGAYSVRATAPGFRPFEQAEGVEADEATVVTYRLEPSEDLESFSATARIDPPPREVTRRTIRREELTRIPGTRGDALRTVELLPGVGRPPFGAGALLVRGSSPQDSQVFLDGIPVPLLYHFGGLTSFISSRMLDRIDFFPGNFSARYGRKSGGVLEVATRDPATDGLHGVVDLNLLDSSILVEAPLHERLSIAVAARRSYIDFLFANVVPSSVFDVVAAPVYWDYQLLATYRPTARDKVRALFYGSSDEFRIVFAEPAEQDPAVRGNLDLRTFFHRGFVEWRRAWSPALDQEVSFAIGPASLEFGLGPALRFELDSLQMLGRAEWTLRPVERVRLIGGMDLQIVPAELTFFGPRPQQQEGNPSLDPISSLDTIRYARELTVYRPAAYLEADLRPVEDLQVVVGLRLDWYRDIEAWSIDPRLVVGYSLDARTRLKAGVGLFSQPPEFHESADEIGNPALGSERALHVGAGVEHAIVEHVRVGLEGFYKRLSDRVVATENGVPPFFVNGGRGRIYGLELSGRIEPRGRLFGFLSYTLSRSERKDRPGDPWRLFDFDQTHILTLSAVYRLGRGWELGGTFRLVSGNPYTPFVGGYYNANIDLYQPLYGATNTARNPLFHRLDVRVEKRWRFQSWSLAVYLDVQNAYNSTNREGVFYNYDYTESSDLPGLPILPSLGVRGEL